MSYYNPVTTRWIAIFALAAQAFSPILLFGCGCGDANATCAAAAMSSACCCAEENSRACQCCGDAHNKSGKLTLCDIACHCGDQPQTPDPPLDTTANSSSELVAIVVAGASAESGAASIDGFQRPASVLNAGLQLSNFKQILLCVWIA